jgi:broad specificity phosphatase PhoE
LPIVSIFAENSSRICSIIFSINIIASNCKLIYYNHMKILIFTYFMSLMCLLSAAVQQEHTETNDKIRKTAVNTPFNVVVVRSYSSSDAPVAVDPKLKKYVSSSISPYSGKFISAENEIKAQELSKTIQSMGPFQKVFCSESKTAQQTAFILFKDQKKHDLIPIERGFNQINLGDLNGVEAGMIQELYQMAHPHATFIPEPNDAMNEEWAPIALTNLQDKSPSLLKVLYKLTHPDVKDIPEDIDYSKVVWPAELKINFEPFREVDKRVCEAFRNLGAQGVSDQKIPTYFVVASKDPIRSIILHSTVGDKLKNSKFYADLAGYLQREPSQNVQIKDFAVRGHFDPKEGSVLTFHCDAHGQISLEGVSDRVEFRAKPPVPSFVKKTPQ